MSTKNSKSKRTDQSQGGRRQDSTVSELSRLPKLSEQRLACGLHLIHFEILCERERTLFHGKILLHFLHDKFILLAFGHDKKSPKGFFPCGNCSSQRANDFAPRQPHDFFAHHQFGPKSSRGDITKKSSSPSLYFWNPRAISASIPKGACLANVC